MIMGMITSRRAVRVLRGFWRWPRRRACWHIFRPRFRGRGRGGFGGRGGVGRSGDRLGLALALRWGTGSETVPALAAEMAALLWSRRDCGQAGGGSFVPDGTLHKEPREPSDQSLGYFLPPSGLEVGSPASEGSVAGFGETGLLAANAFRTFPAFIFKNALAANIGKGSRWKVSGFRWQPAYNQRVAKMPKGGAGEF